jgi:hypothetical protein
MVNWDKQFASAHFTSWPTAGLSISKVSPDPTQGSRSIYNEDKVEIHAAANRHGFSVLHDSKNQISFIKKLVNE